MMNVGDELEGGSTLLPDLLGGAEELFSFFLES